MGHSFIHSFINARRGPNPLPPTGRRDAAKRERVNLSLKRPRAVSLITLQLVHLTPRPAEATRAKRLCFCAGTVSGWLVTNTRFSRLISSDVARNFSLGSKKSVQIISALKVCCRRRSASRSATPVTMIGIAPDH